MSNRDLGECPGDFINNIVNKFPRKLKLVHINAQSLNDSKQGEFIDLFSESDTQVNVLNY